MIEIGKSYTIEQVVTPEMTARAIGSGGLQRQALFSIALVLFVFIMIINVVLNVVLKGGDRDA